MCEFSHKDSVLKNIAYKDAILGSRFWIYNWKENELKSLNRDFYFEKKKVTGNKPNLNGDLGLYSYNYNYYYYSYYNYNNYNYSYNNYNNYYYYYNNYDYNNNYNNYNNYKIAGIIRSYGPTVVHKLGQRSQKIEIVSFLTLKDHTNKEFLNHFNEKVKQAAKQFGVSTVDFQYGENPITNYQTSLITK
jgi:hypothetical protein